MDFHDICGKNSPVSPPEASFAEKKFLPLSAATLPRVAFFWSGLAFVPTRSGLA